MTREREGKEGRERGLGVCLEKEETGKGKVRKRETEGRWNVLGQGGGWQGKRKVRKGERGELRCVGARKRLARQGRVKEGRGKVGDVCGDEEEVDKGRRR